MLQNIISELKHYIKVYNPISDYIIFSLINLVGIFVNYCTILLD